MNLLTKKERIKVIVLGLSRSGYGTGTDYGDFETRKSLFYKFKEKIKPLHKNQVLKFYCFMTFVN